GLLQDIHLWSPRPEKLAMRRLSLLAIIVASCFAMPSWSGTEASAMPDTMRAAAFDRGGGSEVLSIHQLPVPTRKAGEVLIRVHGSAVAVWEADFREHPPQFMRFPAVLGSDG